MNTYDRFYFVNKLCRNLTDDKIFIEKQLVNTILNRDINCLEKFKILENFNRVSPYYKAETVLWIYLTSLELYFKFFTISENFFSKINCFRFLYNSECEKERKEYCRNSLLNYVLQNLRNITYLDLSNITDLFLSIPETTEIARTRLLTELRNRRVNNDINFTIGENFNHTIYTDTQNVHTATISKCVNKRIIALYSDENKHEIDSYQISDVIKDFLKREGLLNSKINTSLDRISIDLAIFTEKKIRLRTILVKIWHRILKMSTENKKEAIKRMVEELIEMSGTCSTGHASRLVNILSELEGGFDSIKISFPDQIKSNIHARINYKIKNDPNNEEILLSMIEKGEQTPYKAFLTKNRTPLFVELLEEFKSLFDKSNENSEILTQTKFTELFNSYYDTL